MNANTVHHHYERKVMSMSDLVARLERMDRERSHKTCECIDWKEFVEAWALMVRDAVVDSVAARHELLKEIRNGSGSIALDVSLVPLGIGMEAASLWQRRLTYLTRGTENEVACKSAVLAATLAHIGSMGGCIDGLGRLCSIDPGYSLILVDDYFDQTVDIPIAVLEVDTVTDSE